MGTEPIFVETEPVFDLVVVDEPGDDVEPRRDPTEVERFLQAEGVVDDFELALNYLVKYQQILHTLQSPDPQYEVVSRLLRKYKFVPHDRSKNYAVYYGAREISDHTDSIPGEVVELTKGEIEQAEEILNALGPGTVEGDDVFESGEHDG